MLNFQIEKSLQGLVAGIDEVGRGPWAGPVTASAVIFHHYDWPTDFWKGVNDSKKLSAAKREKIFEQITAAKDISIGIGFASVEEIDELNILQATFLAMQRAVQNLNVMPQHALVDGSQKPSLPCAVQPIIGGDALCLSIAAASIIAKVTRDRLMQDLAKEYPAYGWQKNAGYGTKDHQDGLAQFGVTPHHRRSFAPIREVIRSKK